MKIVCQSCGAKYSIADEKVAGKVFKIRCKKCSATIVVKGDQQDTDEATRVYDYGADAIWHAVVAGEQQGPFSPRQVGEMLAEGKIDWEAYVWREGMDNWLPAKDVEELVSAVMNENGGDTAQAQNEPSAPAAIFGGSSDMGADPFATDDGGLSSVMGQQAASAVDVGGGADLFGQAARSPFAGAAEEDEPQHAAGSPRVQEAGAMTGQRNENSVLFSLSNLQALATGSGSGASASNARPGMAAGEGSGLIDIRALASATQAVSDKPNGASREKVEDLLVVGSASTAFSAASFAAPVAVERSDNSRLMLGAMGAAILVLGGAVAYLATRDSAPQQIAAVSETSPAAVQPSAPSPSEAQATALPTPAAPATDTKKPEPLAAADIDDKPAKASGNDGADKAGARNDHRKPATGGAPAPAKSADKPAPAAAPAAPAAAPAKKPSTTSDTSIDDLLSGALGGKAAAKPAAAKPAAEALPATPGREDVLSAMKGVAPKVQACANGTTGVAQAKVVVAGPTGRVTSVEVGGAGAGGPAAACISKEVGKAKFPKFSQPNFSFTFPFKL